MDYFNKFIRNSKYICINFILDKCNKLPVDNKVIGNYIRSWHLAAPGNMLLLFLFVPKYIFLAMVTLLLLAFTCFILWKGCILTKIEKELIGDDITFIDPCLQLVGAELTNENRIHSSIIAAFMYLSSIGIIYILRFIHEGDYSWNDFINDYSIGFQLINDLLNPKINNQ